jgi:hypothetical protein
MFLGNPCDLIEPDQGVTTDERRRCDDSTPDGAGGVALIGPEGIVVAISLGHVSKCIDIRPCVAGLRHCMRLGNADSSAQSLNPFLGDHSFAHHVFPSNSVAKALDAGVRVAATSFLRIFPTSLRGNDAARSKATGTL